MSCRIVFCVELDDDGMITQQQMESAIRQLAGTTSERDLVFVIDAFDVPKISYDPITKRLYADNHPKSLIATAQVPAAATSVAAVGI